MKIESGTKLLAISECEMNKTEKALRIGNIYEIKFITIYQNKIMVVIDSESKKNHLFELSNILDYFIFLF